MSKNKKILKWQKRVEKGVKMGYRGLVAKL